MQIVFAPPEGQGGRAELLGSQPRADLHIGKALNRRGCADFRRALRQAFRSEMARGARSVERETGLEPAASSLEGMFVDSNSEPCEFGV